MFTRILTIALLSLLATVPISYFVFDREIHTVEDSRAKLPPGRLIQTGDHLTYHEVRGERWAPRVLLLHGATVPSGIWDRYMAPLSEAGMQVARFDFYGRGFSDRIDGPYDRERHYQQLVDLVEALGWTDRPFDLVGNSMGGAVAATYAARHPESVGNLVLIAPVVDYRDNVPGTVRVPILGEYLLRIVGVPMALGRVNQMATRIPGGAAMMQQFGTQAQTQGFERMLASILRSDTLGDYRDVYADLKDDRDVLLIWGQDDAEIPFEHMQYLQQTIPGLTFMPIPGAGHGVGVAQANLIVDLMIPWLKRNG